MYTASFAPPPQYGFAPPPSYDNDGPNSSATPAGSATITNDTTGEDAYARRMRLSQPQPHPPPPEPTFNDSTPPPPPPAAQQQLQPPPPPPPQTPTPSAPISRAPIRYTLPTPSPALPTSEAELDAAIAQADAEDGPEDDTTAPRSNRPGQKGFAARLMTKYGWTAGSGLGAAGNTGIVAPLRVQVEKRKKRPDAEGGGFVGGAAAKGRIVGGRRPDEGAGAGNGLSEVVKLVGMLDGLDVAAEVAGGLMQEIGDECAEKYGMVERVYVHREGGEGQVPVFVKFTSQLSALRVSLYPGRE